MKRDINYLFLYFAIVFGVWWVGVVVLTSYRAFLTPYIGELSLSHPIVIFFTYLPSIAGVLIYFQMGGLGAVKKLLLKLIPRKRDLFLFPVLFSVGICFILFMRFGSSFFGMNVPKITFSIHEIIIKAVLNFFEETALIGGCLGWVGFLLPFLQTKIKNSTASGMLTGLIFGLWVLCMPYLLNNPTVNLSFVLYIIQLMTLFVFVSYIFNITKGNISFYLFTFWLVATGSHVQMYFFNQKIQLMQIVFFLIVSILTRLYLLKIKHPLILQTFPSYIEN